MSRSLVLASLLCAPSLAQVPTLAVSGGQLAQSATYTLSGTLSVVGVPEVLAIDTVSIPGGIPLGALGTLYLGLSPSFVTVGGNGSHQWVVPVPGDPGVVGLTFHAQALGFVFDPFTLGGQFKLSTLASITITSAPLDIPRFGYVTNQTDDTVSIYALESASGQLRHAGYVHTGASSGPRAAATTPDGKRLYVALNTSAQVAGYSIASASGQLTSVGAPVAAGGTGAVALCVDPSSKFVYVAGTNGAIGAFAIQPATGVLTPVAGSPFSAGTTPSALAVEPAGKFLYVANSASNNLSAFAINASSGALTPVAGSPFAAGTGPAALAFAPGGGFLYCSNAGASDSISAFAINASNGVLTPIAGSPFAAGGTDPLSIGVDPSGPYLYAANLLGTSLTPYALNPSTGALTAGANIASGSAPIALAIDAHSHRVYSVNTGDSEIRAYSIGAAGALSGLAPFETRTRNGPTSLVFARGANALSFESDALFSANFTANDVNQYGLNLATGAPTSGIPPTVAALVSPNAIEVHPFADFAYLTYFNSAGTSIGIFSIAGGLLSPAGTAGTTNGNWATAIDPSGRFAFKTSGASPGAVTPYSINSASGALTAGSDAATQSFPRGLGLHPNGKWLYVANQFSNTLSQYAVNPSTGALSALVPATVATGAGPVAVSVDPTGRFAYAACTGGASGSGALDGSVSMYAVNASTGALTVLAAAPPTPFQDAFELAPAPSGRFLFVADQDADLVRRFALNTNPTNGTEDGALIELNPPLATAPGSGPRSIRVNAAGTKLYVSLNASATVETYTIAADGALTLADTDAAGTGVRGIGLRSRKK